MVAFCQLCFLKKWWWWLIDDDVYVRTMWIADFFQWWCRLEFKRHQWLNSDDTFLQRAFCFEDIFLLGGRGILTRQQNSAVCVIDCVGHSVYWCVVCVSFLHFCVVLNCVLFIMCQAKIAFLQGERKGQENLKCDLVRRIKMLEFALRQERCVSLLIIVTLVVQIDRLGLCVCVAGR